MNILILFSQPWRVGGAETHVEALIQGLKGHKVFLAVNEGSREDKLEKLSRDYPDLKIVKIQARGVNVWRWHHDIKRLAALILKERIGVISAQQRTAGIWSYFLNRKTGVKYTVTMHDPWHRAKFKPVYAKIFPAIFAVSGNLVRALRGDFGFQEDQVIPIHNGIDFKKFIPMPLDEAREKIGVSKQAGIILHVSRLSSVKGAVSLKLIESMDMILREKREAQLLIVGEGPLRPKIEKEISVFNNLHGEKIKIYDFVDNIMDWYNACDILVGEGRVAIEALACHKPIVAIRNAERFIGLITQENIAYACDVNFDGKDRPVSLENMKDAVMAAFAQEALETADAAGYVKERLSIEKMTETYLRVFHSL